MINIAIDGPAGAGKSTIAKAAAGALGYIYVDTGALYRSIALYMLRYGVDAGDETAVAPLLKQIRLELKFIDGTQQVYMNGENVSDQIRTPEVSMGASNVSAIPAVRAFLLELQRNIAAKNNVIMDGRDIGTVILPHADVKVFLTASPECRAKRRFKELCEKGQQVQYETVLAEILERDYNDSHREIAPLKPTDESIVLDTTPFTLEQSVDVLLSIIKEKTA